MHKRKHQKSFRDEQSAHNVSQQTISVETPDSFLHIRAHEADVIRGPLAASGQSLECRDLSAMLASSNDPKSGLIRWGPSEHPDSDMGTAGPGQSGRPPLWVDRYDVRLLLDDLPDLPPGTVPVRPLSPSGWSDLPSDSEDTFFFSPDELEDYRREKRRRLIDRDREERLRALATADADGQEDDPDPWGGSDEEPDEAQRELIRRTASHIISSPNSAQLEMRILANYGTDKRFAFLRGRWSRVWRIEREKARQQQADEAKRVQPPTLLGGLASYGDSDSDDEGLEDKQAEAPTLENEDVKEARRARAREWSARRRVEQPRKPSK